MANQIKLGTIVGGVHVKLSAFYRAVIEEYSESTFWYHLRNAMMQARVEGHIEIPGDDTETFAAIMRLYFESNGVYEILSDETKEVTLVIYSHTTKYKMVKKDGIAGATTMCPLTQWSLTIKEVTPSCPGN